tara:strand:+ start:172 stop:546 length:375 start_codon:yes stop_codon:yes gene_type:complete
MGRINRRIYSKRRRRSPVKFIEAIAAAGKAIGGMSNELTNQAQAQGTLARQKTPTSGLASLAGRSGSLLGMMGAAGRATYQRDKELQEMSNFYASQDGGTIGNGGNEGGQDFNANGINIKITKI